MVCKSDIFGSSPEILLIHCRELCHVVPTVVHFVLGGRNHREALRALGHGDQAAI